MVPSLENIFRGFCFLNSVRIENSIAAVQRRVACFYLLAEIWPKQLFHQFFSQRQGNYYIWDSSVTNVAGKKEKNPLLYSKPSEAEFRVLHIHKRVWDNKELGLGLPKKKTAIHR